MSEPKIRSILATDCGSTTTKCILIEWGEDGYRLAVRGEAPTTVEAPAEDVTQGVLNAVREVSELIGRPLLDENGELIRPYDREKNQGIDIYLSTSSAGGGLQMVVGGVVREMTAKSAEKAALGAGAIVMDVLAVNDGRLPHEKIELIRQLRPDMLLLAGGVDGGTVKHVVELAQVVGAADPKPRLGIAYELPVIFAGNKDAQEPIRETLAKKTALEVVDNLRPAMDKENLQPSRLKIQEQFLEHVMAHAPGYPNLMKMTDEEIMPTPAAVGSIMETIAKRDEINIVGVDIGGATTDVFSVLDGVFNRTVSANFGMSYSFSNVYAEAGHEQVMRWVPFSLDERELRNRIKNKMIRPTSIPYLLEELILEQAMAREALRLSFDQHKSLVTGLKGVQKKSDLSALFGLGDEESDTLIDMRKVNMLIGSGGVLSHAPRRHQTAMMLIDSFLPEGVTTLTVDSIFMMPQLGVLAEVHPDAATQVFERDCLIYLGDCVAPVGRVKPGETAMEVQIDGEKLTVRGGEMIVKQRERDLGPTQVTIHPARGLDMGAGPGKSFQCELYGGTVGVIFDGRGRRPFSFQNAVTDLSEKDRLDYLSKWNESLQLYPDFKGAGH
ncbi:MAG TPA: methylaspartate mutase [Phycisphaerales bacterium]|nr:methylaspartate mutase [Phycisphaerales bacterium]